MRQLLPINKVIRHFVIRHFKVIGLFCLLMVGFSAHAQVSPFNLLVNGDFEGGGSGNGFQVQAPYNFIGTPPPLTGNSAPGDYAIIPNPQPMNLANFIPGTDHSGTGKMMVVDGTTVGGGQRFWKAGSTGGGVGPLTVGLTYTFSYWKKSVSITAVDAGTSANISVAWNNAASVTLVSGSEQVSFPGTTSVWEKITYSFVPTNAWVNIELYNNNTNPVGNDFAIDDMEVLPPPTPLGIRYSFVQPACPGGNDGSITAYGTGGSLPYAYNLNGGTFTGNNMFTGLPGGAGYEIRTRDNENNIAISNPAIVLTEPVNPLTVRNDTSICQGNSINLQATATGSGSFSWTANPPDPSLLNPNIANPVVSPATPTTYTVNYSYTFARDLIYNGNFELGDLGFATEYSFIANNATGAQRAYSVTNNPNTFEPGFSNLCVDHSTGTGKMMVVDGSTNPNTVVWKQKVPVQPNTNYTFRYWLQTVAMPSSVASIETLINGQPITGSSLTSTLSAGALCNWAQFTANWNAGTSIEAEIILINRNTAASGNDFALDDISFTSSQTCIVSKSVFVDVVSSNTPVTGFSYTSPVCSNASPQSPTLGTGFSSGGTFSAGTGLSINPSTGQINVAASTPGTYTVTYNIPASGCQIAGSNTATISINNSITPVTGFSYTSPVCSNASPISPTLGTGFSSGGTFSAGAGLSINPSNGQINVAASTPGTYTVTYNVPASGCQIAGSGTATISINNSITPVTGFNYTSPVCSNASPLSPTLGTGFSSGGTFSAGTGLSINPSNGQINVAASTPGTYTVTYNIPASGCQLAGSSTATISINNSITPVTGFSYTSPVCSNASPLSPTLGTGFSIGGSFSAGAGLSINPSTGQINVAASTPGTYTVTYNIPASGCQIAGSNTATISINNSITPVTGFSYTSPVCSNASPLSPTLGTGFSSGGSFSAGAGLSINPSTGQINVAASTPGTYTVSYNVPASGCQIAGSNTATISINNTITPVTGFSYTSPVCSNASPLSPTLGTGFSSGGTFSAGTGLSINPSTGLINVATSTPGTYSITYNIPASGCQIAGSNTTTISINNSITPVTGFSYTSPVCSNASPLSPTFGTGFSSGGTFSAGTGLSINPSTGQINVGASTPGTYTVTYNIPANGCQIAGSGTAGIIITASPGAPIANDVTKCGPGIFTLEANSNGSINWYADAGLTNLLHVGAVYQPALDSSTSFYVQAELNGCTSDAVMVRAIVAANPTKPNLGPDKLLCPGDKVTLSAGNYAQYNWSNGSGAASIEVSDAGIYIVEVGNTFGCLASDTVQISIASNCDDIYFPGAFSPNGDGLNDHFKPLGNIAFVSNYELIVYNRYGEVVFRSVDPNSGWDGFFKNKQNAQSNYVYMASYRFRAGAIRYRKGNLVLIR